ncbi:MAG: hypothetical protein WA006_00460, partial [Rhodoglobus sp.]
MDHIRIGRATATMMVGERLRGWVSHALEDPSPAVKQSATAVGVAVAAIIALVVPGAGFANELFAIAGLVIVGLATAISLILTPNETLARWALIIPIIDLLGLGAFRMGTGGIASMFSAL